MTPNEETGRRFCMLSEFMFGKPVYESYKTLCSKIGNDTISYQEFDFWFHRFAQGKLDLSYDRSLDPKPKELSDMPIEIVDNIVDDLGPVERLSVRNVSQGLRDLIDKRTTDVQWIEFTIEDDHFSVYASGVHTEYRESDVRKTSLAKSYYGQKALIEGPGAMKNSLIHLAHYLKNPKLKLINLSIFGLSANEVQGIHNNWDIVTQCYQMLEQLLLSLEHQISTETFRYTFLPGYTLLVALKSLKPGVLNDISDETYYERFEEYEVQEEIVGTEQWKQAKKFSSIASMPGIVDGIAHFEEFTLRWNEIDPENVVRLKELLSESKTFKKGELSIVSPELPFDIHIDRIIEALGPRIFRDPENPDKWSYPIPDTNKFLDFYQKGAYTFSIERTT